MSRSGSGPGLKCKPYKELQNTSHTNNHRHFKESTEDLCLHSPEEEGGSYRDVTVDLEASLVGDPLVRDGAMKRHRKKSNSILGFIKPVLLPATRTSTTAEPVGADSATGDRGGGGNTAVLVSTYLKSSTCTSPDNSSVENTCTSKEIDQFYMNATEVMSENAHLRELLLSQLDIIQQQSDAIIQRDRQMRALRIENEQLRQRLERMERRVRGGGGDVSPAPSPKPQAVKPVITSGPPPSSEPTPQQSKRQRQRSSDGSVDRALGPPLKMIKLEAPPSLPQTPASEPQLSRQLNNTYAGSSNNGDFPLDNLTDEIFAESDESFSTPSVYHKNMISGDDAARPSVNGDADGDRLLLNHKSENLSTANRRKEDLGAAADGHYIVSTPDQRPAKKRLSSQKMSPDVGSGSNTAKAARRGGRRSTGRPPSRPSITLSVTGEGEPLLTSYHYYVGCGNEIYNVDDKLTEIALLQQGVEVPRWREDVHYKINLAKNKTKKSHHAESSGWSVVCPGSQGDTSQDGVEITEDSHFLKRHEKREAAEKRTKKWDMQRARERCYNEKLKARYLRVKRRPEEPDTLLPALEGAEKIRVSADLPVSAFGETVPSLSVSHFILPWLDDLPVKLEASSCRTAAIKAETPTTACHQLATTGGASVSRRSRLQL